MIGLGRLYGRATEMRRVWYRRRPHRARRLDRPVISVGNLVMGGSGKTPLVATIARLLVAAGERPAILSRGYGRREHADGVVVVSDGNRVLASPPQAGDEPSMLAQALPGVPVLVCADRYLAGRLAERRFDCSVHLLDDGFQHVQLARDVDLVVIGRADLDERLLPFGRLREPVAAARAADALFVPGGDEDVRAVREATGLETISRVVPRYAAPRRADLGVDPYMDPRRDVGADLEVGPGRGPRRALAVAGIARPERFFAALRDLGWDVVREMRFRDHHWFTARDIAAIERAAAECGADVVMTTEKDAVRMAAFVGRAFVAGSPPRTLARWGASGPPREPDRARAATAYLPMELTIEPADRFAAWLNERLAAARERTGVAA